MFISEGRIIWSASDVAAASECEFRVARQADVCLGHAQPIEQEEDALQRRVAVLGDEHEQRVRHDYASHKPVVEIDRLVGAHTDEAMRAIHERSMAACDGNSVVHQPAFYDGEFFGYADFLESTEDGWVVTDAKLARSAKPRALLQVAAYAEQLREARFPLAPHGALLLGDGRREEVPLDDVLPVFRARRERLRELIAERKRAGEALAWGQDGHTICGSCPECEAAIKESEDCLLVAGVRRDQRMKLRSAGIDTIRQLAAAEQGPEDLPTDTFEKLRAQAALQIKQKDTGEVCFERIEPTIGTAQAPTIPPPSAGDIFFDFEGDPLHSEPGSQQQGLEYLWGLRMATGIPGAGDFVPLWAHSYAQEREALADFIERVRQRREQYPDMHIYHYAPYETTALKRLVGTYGIFEAELDDLLKADVFVDLYSAVRGSMRLSQPSYSIKKLEPLYMGDELREGDVQEGATSIAEYHLVRSAREMGDEESAQRRLHELEDYNAYDCLSTQRLRDWLLDEGIVMTKREALEATETEQQPLSDLQQACAAMTDRLLLRADQETGESRAQAWRLLAAAVGYHRREDLPFWWDHFSRLKADMGQWSATRDVFFVNEAEVVEPWGTTGHQRNPRRTIGLKGAWDPGSSGARTAFAIYTPPGPPGNTGTYIHQDGFAYVWAKGEVGVSIPDPETPERVEVVESCSPDVAFDDTPVALTPTPIQAHPVVKALLRHCESVLAGAGPPHTNVWRLLTRQVPVLTTGEGLPTLDTAEAATTVTAAVRSLDSSYLAIQGPPGSGKSRTAARVIRSLVADHGWSVAVVAQSHAVVESLLDSIVEQGLDPDVVGKNDPRSDTPTWTVAPKDKDKRAKWIQERKDSGRGAVFGGTAWTFSSEPLAGMFDLMVVDEAGQYSLANTIAVSDAAKNLLLLGDPQQLPQVSQGTHPEPVDDSALGWLMQGHRTLPEDYGYFLPTSYRMNAPVCDPISRLAYEGHLTSSAPERHLEGFASGLHAIPVPHEGNRVSSVEEADAIARQIGTLLGRQWVDGGDRSDLGQDDILVVAPYNAQVTLIRRTLKTHGLEGVRVGTVDKFQGQQAPVTIVSLAVSSPADAPRGMDFLLNRNRLNVAISRAKWASIIVHSPRLTHYMPTTSAGLRELGAFLGLLESASALSEVADTIRT